MNIFPHLKDKKDLARGWIGLEGCVWEEDGVWLVEVPLLDVVTQGQTEKEALHMIRDAIESLADKEGFTVEIHEEGSGSIGVYCPRSSSALLALMLKRLRVANGLSLAEVAEHLNQKSKNAYARYEQGKSVPTIDKLAELLQAVDPKLFVLIRDVKMKRSNFIEGESSKSERF